jgi:phosphate starvation-inducible PhoH-like protein
MPREETFDVADTALARALLGPGNANLRPVADGCGVELSTQGTEVRLCGAAADVARARRLLEGLLELLRGGCALGMAEVEQAVRLAGENERVSLKDIFLDTVFVSHRAQRITPRGLGQKRYVEAIRRHDMVFGIGPAGTGKTFLAMTMAVAALKKQQVQRIIITRPAVEAGERLGFLPGDLAQKVHPYLRPMYDALHDLMEAEQAQRLMDRGILEVAPLAFMRGRTLNDAFIILDEAQNTTSDQMKMFLTRLGYRSKAVITGDITQIDLPAERRSGLVEARDILAGVEGIAFCFFSEKDVVRHPLVQDVIRAYERAERRSPAREETSERD